MIAADLKFILAPVTDPGLFCANNPNYQRGTADWFAPNEPISTRLTAKAYTALLRLRERPIPKNVAPARSTTIINDVVMSLAIRSLP
jgi:hypothetical protein